MRQPNEVSAVREGHGLRTLALAAAVEPSKASTSCSLSVCKYVPDSLALVQGLRVFASAAAPEPSKAERQVWFPGNKAPDYLDGSLNTTQSVGRPSCLCDLSVAAAWLFVQSAEDNPCLLASESS